MGSNDWQPRVIGGNARRGGGSLAHVEVSYILVGVSSAQGTVCWASIWVWIGLDVETIVSDDKTMQQKSRSRDICIKLRFNHFHMTPLTNCASSGHREAVLKRCLMVELRIFYFLCHAAEKMSK